MAQGNPFNYQGKVTLQRVRINSQGYTAAGHYFGTGKPLYWFTTDDPHEHFISGYSDGDIRAANRSEAKAIIRAMPLMADCKFYR